MKSCLCLIAACAIGTSLLADEITVDEWSDPETILCENGNIFFSVIGNHCVTPCKWIRLSTNSNYKVVCQIAYDNAAFDGGPSTPAEIMQARQVENFMNLALLKFLQKNYGDLSDAELAKKYRSRSIQARIEDASTGFAEWFERIKDSLKSLHKNTPVGDVTIWKVSMRAVGPFAEAIEAL